MSNAEPPCEEGAGSEESEYELEASELRYDSTRTGGYPSEYKSQAAVPLDANDESQKLLVNLNVQHQSAEEAKDHGDGFEDARENEEEGECEEEHESDHEDDQNQGPHSREWVDPLWYGKSVEEIRIACENEKSLGNNESRRQNWKQAVFYWKRCLKGAQKLGDHEYEVKIRLNLALGYTKRQKGEKARDHCDVILSEPLLSAAIGPLRAKAHYRRADALVECQEFSRALQELRSVLEIEAQNADARKRYAEVQEQERRYREREKEMFQGKLGPAKDSSQKSQSAAKETEAELKKDEESGHSKRRVSFEGESPKKDQEESEQSEEEEKEVPRLKSATRTTRDRLEHRANQEAQNKLADSLLNPHKMNVQVGEMQYFQGTRDE